MMIPTSAVRMEHRAKLAPFLKLFESGLELREHKLAAVGEVGNGGLPVLMALGLSPKAV
jgi:hypothetical protein